MNSFHAQPVEHELSLADGSRWAIAAGDAEAASVVSRLGHAMQLPVTDPSATRFRTARWTSTPAAGETPRPGRVRRLFVMVDAHARGASPATCYPPFLREDDGLMVCVLRSLAFSDGLFVQLVGMSSTIARDAHTRGGVLLHGALAEKGGIGVILAAPGGTGKTTASARLPAPWRSRCDDTTLVVRDAQGGYWAHPWPTWSRFLGGAPGGTWDVQGAVPLKGIFLLSRAAVDRVECVGSGRAVGLLIECAEQASQFMMRGLDAPEARNLRMERFNNLCGLALAVPTHVLRISLAGAFWIEIERTLEGRAREGS